MRRASIAIALMTLAFVYGQVTSLRAEPEKWERPEVKVGDSWTYQQKDLWTNTVQPPYTQTVEAVSEVSIRVQSTNQDGRHFNFVFTRDWNVSERPGPRKVEPYWPSYSWPLEVGKKWSGDATWRAQDPSQLGTWKGTFQSQVTKVEKITVAAGTFDTIKIERRGRYVTDATISGWRGWSGEILETVWYAPAVRRAVKFTYTDTSGSRIFSKNETELIQYKLSE